ncbi:RidA family protein [Candidimonas sp. SYP-B2681]|uniref:RidA family protein n=1 Tax=Candidimonas sp. SYP-B2681 TaxID=2497686 RepID=UPI000F88E3B6|nr:RidA family protein [Candidimonas sp. SYP-B2681]RTZ47831.1 RidA family protein [Candidimonas sp. SYP-B2681]
MNIVYKNSANLKHRSDSVIHNGIAYVSGAIPSDSSVDIITQSQQVLAELDARLAEAGSGKDKILSATIWMLDVNRDVGAFNTVWNQWVVPGRVPARSCVQAVLQQGALLEVAIVAAI